jgi:uncharacterized protein (DUF2062 family)
MTAPAPEHSPPRGWRSRLRSLLAQGLQPRQIAWGLAAGAVIGCLPLLGASTTVALLVTTVARLNHALVQAVNYAVYPLQLLLLLPFWRAGEWLFGLPPLPLLDVAAVLAHFEADFWRASLDYLQIAVAGAAVWALLALPLSWLIARASLPLITRLAAARGAA